MPLVTRPSRCCLGSKRRARFGRERVRHLMDHGSRPGQIRGTIAAQLALRIAQRHHRRRLRADAFRRGQALCGLVPARSADSGAVCRSRLLARIWLAPGIGRRFSPAVPAAGQWRGRTLRACPREWLIAWAGAIAPGAPHALQPCRVTPTRAGFPSLCNTASQLPILREYPVAT